MLAVGFEHFVLWRQLPGRVECPIIPVSGDDRSPLECRGLAGGDAGSPARRSAGLSLRAGVRGHLQEIEDPARVPGQIAQGLGDGEAAGLDKADGEAPEPGHVLWTVPGAATVLVEAPVEDVMRRLELSIGLLLFQSKFRALQISIQHTGTIEQFWHRPNGCKIAMASLHGRNGRRNP